MVVSAVLSEVLKLRKAAYDSDAFLTPQRHSHGSSEVPQRPLRPEWCQSLACRRGPDCVRSTTRRRCCPSGGVGCPEVRPGAALRSVMVSAGHRALNSPLKPLSPPSSALLALVGRPLFLLGLQSFSGRGFLQSCLARIDRRPTERTSRPTASNP